MYNLYYNTVLKSIKSDLEIFKLRDIEYKNIIKRFNKTY